MMKLHERIETVQVAILSLEGRVDVVNAPQIREWGQSKFARQITHFVVDLSAVDFLDSAGLASLVNLLKNARREGGNVRLIMPAAETARRTLTLTRFDQVFDLYNDVAAALKF
jgi:anti-sigma B factor antagonist